MTNVICNLPVGAPGAWVCGGARPWSYHEAQICPLDDIQYSKETSRTSSAGAFCQGPSLSQAY